MTKYFIIAAMIITGTFFGATGTTQAAFGIPTGGAELTGFAWSGYTNPLTGGLEGVGWISMNCSNTDTCATSDYKVTLNTDGTLSGYAWSSNIGWIRFGGLSGFPAGSGVANANATAVGTYPDIDLTGWARACSAATDPISCSGGMNPNAGGWDGWIALAGTTGTTVTAIGTPASVATANGVDSVTCPAGQVITGITYEAATWSSNVDNHILPEVRAVDCAPAGVGTSARVNVTSGVDSITCPAGQVITGLVFEPATWSNGTDNHANPEVQAVACAAASIGTSLRYGVGNGAMRMVCPAGRVATGLTFEPNTWSNADDTHGYPEITNINCAQPLAGGATPPSGSPSVSSNYAVRFVGGTATADSYAWGGPNTMGWIDFSPAGTPGVQLNGAVPPVVSLNCPTVVAPGNTTCTYNPNVDGGDAPDSCTLTSTNGDNVSVPTVAGTITVNPLVTTTYTLVCALGGVSSVPVDQTIDVRPDILIANPTIATGSLNPSTGVYNTVDVRFQVLNVPNGETVPYRVQLGTLTPQTGFITGTAAAQSVSARFTNIAFSAGLGYVIEVDDSPNQGVVFENLPSTPANEDINRYDGTAILPAPNPTILIDMPDFVRTGNPVDVGVTVTAMYPTACEIFGPGFGPTGFSVTAGVTYTNTFPTAILTNATNIAVRCTVPGSADFSVSESVEVTPAFQEV